MGYVGFSMNHDFYDLDFERGIAAFSFIDRKAEVRLNLGLVTKPPKAIQALCEKYHNVMIGIESAGIDQERMDQICNSMKLECTNSSVDVLIAKGNRPFASSWYVVGDIPRLLVMAENGTMKAPFTEMVHEQIWRAHQVLSDTNKQR